MATVSAGQWRAMLLSSASLDAVVAQHSEKYLDAASRQMGVALWLTEERLAHDEVQAAGMQLAEDALNAATLSADQTR